MSDEKELMIKILADGQQAIREIDKVKKKLEELKDKTVTVTVKVNQEGLRDLGKLGDLHRDAAKGLGDHARASAKAASSARDHAKAGRDAGKALKDLANNAERADKAISNMGDSGRLRELQVAGAGASTQFKELGSNASAAATKMGRLEKQAGATGEGLDRSTVSMSAATDQASAHADAMDRVVAVQRDYNRTVNRGGGGDGGRGGGGGIPPGGGGGGKTGLGGGGDDDGLPNLTRNLNKAANAGGNLNRVLLKGAGYGVLGAGIVGGVAELGAMAIGIGSVANMIAESPKMMQQGKNALKSYTSGLKESRVEAQGNAAPAFNDLKREMGGLGREVGKIAAANMDNVLGGAASMAGTAAVALNKLAPSIGPAIDAGVDLGNAIIGGVGRSGPALDRMSSAISANAEGMGKLVESAISAGSYVVSGAANVLGGIGEILQPDPGTFAGRSNKALSDVVGSKAGQFAGATAGAAWGLAGEFMSPDTAGSAASGKRMQGFADRINSVVDIPGMLAGGLDAVGLSGAAQSVRTSQANAPRTYNEGRGAENVAFNPDYSGPGQGPGPKPGQDVFQPERRMPISSPRGPEFGQKDAVTGAPNITGAAERAAQMVPGAGPKPPPSLGQKGPGQGVGDASALQQYAAQLNQTGQTALTAGSQINQGMQVARNGTQGAAPQMQQQMAGAQAAVQGAQSAIPPAAQQAFSSINSAAQQVQPAPAIQAPIQAAVQSVSDMSGAAASAGSSVGSSIGAGAAAGTTSSFEVVDTVIKKRVLRVIEEAAGTLDAHSPSRKFISLFMSTGQGAAIGTERSFGAAIKSAGSMTGKVVSAAESQLSGASGAAAGSAYMGGIAGQLAGGGLGSGALGGGLSGYLGGGGGYGGGYTGYMSGAGDSGGYGGYDSPNVGGGGGGGFGTPGYDSNPEAGGGGRPENRRPGGLGGLDEGTKQRMQADRRAGLERRGFSKGTIDSILSREEGRELNKQRIAQQKADNQGAAKYRANFGEPGGTAGDPQKAMSGAWGEVARERKANKDAWKDGRNRVADSAAANKASENAAWKRQGDATLMRNPRSTGSGESIMDKQGLLPKAGQENRMQWLGTAKDNARVLGMDIPQATAKGVDAKAAQAKAAVERMNQQMIVAQNAKWKKKSPPRVAVEHGQSIASATGLGVGQGLASASGPMAGMASNAGLMAGYVYAARFGDSFGGAAFSVINKQMLKPTTPPQIASDAAKQWLAQNGLWSAAGSGAQQYKLPAISMAGPGSAAQPSQPIVIHNYMDGERIRTWVLDKFESEWEQFGYDYSDAAG